MHNRKNKNTGNRVFDVEQFLMTNSAHALAQLFSTADCA